MTPSEGFETWRKSQGENPLEMLPSEIWRAACAWQRARDAELVKHHVNGRGPLRTQLATAIREVG